MARLLYVLPHSTEAPERTATALAAAAAAASAGHEVALWLLEEGVRLGVAGVAETLGRLGEEPAAESIATLASRNATFYCSRRSFEAREYEADQLLECARLAEPEQLASLVTEGWIPIPT